MARDRVLASLKNIARQTWRRLVRELQGYAAMKGSNVSLATFLNDQALELSDIYRANAAGGWTALRRSAGLITGAATDEEGYIGAVSPICSMRWIRWHCNCGGSSLPRAPKLGTR